MNQRNEIHDCFTTSRSLILVSVLLSTSVSKCGLVLVLSLKEMALIHFLSNNFNRVAL